MSHVYGGAVGSDRIDARSGIQEPFCCRRDDQVLGRLRRGSKRNEPGTTTTALLAQLAFTRTCCALQDGNTALIRVARNHNLAAVAYLVEHGADVNTKSRVQQSPLTCSSAESM